MLETDLKNKINETLTNWGRWCMGSAGGPLGYSIPPTSRDYQPTDTRDKTHRLHDIDVVDAEAANFAIVNLALAGDMLSYQVIVAWWAHHWPARVIARRLHCSTRSVYNYRLYAMAQFWPEYLRECDKNKRQTRLYLPKTLPEEIFI